MATVLSAMDSFQGLCLEKKLKRVLKLLILSVQCDSLCSVARRIINSFNNFYYSSMSNINHPNQLHPMVNGVSNMTPNSNILSIPSKKATRYYLGPLVDVLLPDSLSVSPSNLIRASREKFLGLSNLHPHTSFEPEKTQGKSGSMSVQHSDASESISNENERKSNTLFKNLAPVENFCTPPNYSQMLLQKLAPKKSTRSARCELMTLVEDVDLSPEFPDYSSLRRRLWPKSAPGKQDASIRKSNIVKRSPRREFDQANGPRRSQRLAEKTARQKQPLSKAAVIRQSGYFFRRTTLSSGTRLNKRRAIATL
ncbi:hypothetical protein O181_029180 [Austropuccinia psidii MF-1]|uniref:Uncharacterized protein n=1 Tax=Austropuccinia psidii MF-1 TaxID=1389203 RepID=A0A9Q3CU12_9BASI|nr:hypothetical protein [Austropuccinia psidii MF-1]